MKRKTLFLLLGLGFLVLMRGKRAAGAGAGGVAIPRGDSPGTWNLPGSGAGDCPPGYVPAVDLIGRRIPGECMPAGART